MCLVAAIQCSLFLLYIHSVCVTFKNRSREFVSWQPNFYQKFEIFTKQSAVPVLAKIRQVACRRTRLIRLTFTDCLQIGRFKIVRRFSYDISTYCALFDKSTKFGTEVNRYNMSKSGCGAIGQLPPGGRGGHFPKWPPADTRKSTEVRMSTGLRAFRIACPGQYNLGRTQYQTPK